MSFQSGFISSCCSSCCVIITIIIIYVLIIKYAVGLGMSSAMKNNSASLTTPMTHN